MDRNSENLEYELQEKIKNMIVLTVKISPLYSRDGKLTTNDGGSRC